MTDVVPGDSDFELSMFCTRESADLSNVRFPGFDSADPFARQVYLEAFKLLLREAPAFQKNPFRRVSDFDADFSFLNSLDDVSHARAMDRLFMLVTHEYATNKSFVSEALDADIFYPDARSAILKYFQGRWQDPEESQLPAWLLSVPDVIRRMLLERTVAIQLTIGCSLGCRDCYLKAERGVREAFTYPAVLELFSSYSEELFKSWPNLYYASDPLDWVRMAAWDGSSLDYLAVHKLYEDLIGLIPSVSTAVPMGKEYLVEEMVRDDIYARISVSAVNRARLKQKLPELMEHLPSHMPKGGQVDVGSIYLHLIPFDKRLGRSGSPEEPDSDALTVTHSPHCLDGVVLTPEGVINSVKMPVCPKYSGGLVEVPVDMNLMKCGLPQEACSIEDLLSRGLVTPAHRGSSIFYRDEKWKDIFGGRAINIVELQNAASALNKGYYLLDSVTGMAEPVSEIDFILTRSDKFNVLLLMNFLQDRESALGIFSLRSRHALAHVLKNRHMNHMWSNHFLEFSAVVRDLVTFSQTSLENAGLSRLHSKEDFERFRNAQAVIAGILNVDSLRSGDTETFLCSDGIHLFIQRIYLWAMSRDTGEEAPGLNNIYFKDCLGYLGMAIHELLPEADSLRAFTPQTLATALGLYFLGTEDFMKDNEEYRGSIRTSQCELIKSTDLFAPIIADRLVVRRTELESGARWIKRETKSFQG